MEKIGTAGHEQIGYLPECLDLECSKQIHREQYEGVRPRAAG
jgi:hypothetical protein